MNKGQRLKKVKKENNTFILKTQISKELQEDSIAHLVKSYFTIGNIHNSELVKYDKERKKILISKKALNHLFRICDSELLEQDFDMELVSEINVIKKD